MRLLKSASSFLNKGIQVQLKFCIMSTKAIVSVGYSRFNMCTMSLRPLLSGLALSGFVISAPGKLQRY